MIRVDQFESVFRSAARTVFEPKSIEVESVLVVCDGDGSSAEEFAALHLALAIGYVLIGT